MLFSLRRSCTLFITCSFIKSRLNLFSYLREKAMTLHCAWMCAKYSHEFMQQSHSIIKIHQQTLLLRRVPHNCCGKQVISSLQHFSIRTQEKFYLTRNGAQTLRFPYGFSGEGCVVGYGQHLYATVKQLFHKRLCKQGEWMYHQLSHDL